MIEISLLIKIAPFHVLGRFRGNRGNCGIRENFPFSSQNKYLLPIITFVHGVNPYLETLFQISKKSDLPPIPVIPTAERIRDIGGNF